MKIKRQILIGFVIIMAILIIMMPIPSNQPAYSKVLYSSEGQLLSATISTDQQWCFPSSEKIPENLKTAIITYEDEYMAFHPGVNPIAIVKAMIANQKSGRTIRGASTLTMQLMRMKNKNTKRNWSNKILEMISAIKYSILHTDETIVNEWTQIAPFGGNTIGVRAASLRYFGRSIDHLSWSEYALLAVMPNGPSYANLTKNRNILKSKRDFLLHKLMKNGHFDESELSLYQDEDLPIETKAIPQYAYHSLQYLSKLYPNQFIFHSTIPYETQVRIQDLVERESSFLKSDDIRNISAIIVDIKSNQLLAYIGNVPTEKGQFSYVDIAQSPRSYGSLLKPILYAHSLETNQFLPNEMIADIPTAIGEFQPQNFDKKFRGAVPYEDVLIQSLNVPSVRVLNTLGMQNFYRLIQNLDIAYLNKGSDHYGLSIILGGGESSLWDLSRIYKGLAQNYMGSQDPFKPIQMLSNERPKSKNPEVQFSGSTMNYLVKAMSDLTRPREEKSWQLYGTDYKVAWKTGTSFGHKDAWSLGFNGRYMVGVWVGNEGGEGRFDLTGISKAAPVMFKIFNTMPENQWFSTTPVYQKKEIITVCVESGKLASTLCKKTSKLVTESASYKYQPCTFHQEMWLNAKGQALSDPCREYAVKKDTVFQLPSYMEYYYKASHDEYKGAPAFDDTCQPTSSAACKIIYPNEGLKIFLPKEAEDKQNDFIAKAYHRQSQAKLFWFVDEKYITTTDKEPHSCLFHLKAGHHTINITDQWGNNDVVHFDIL